MKILKVAFLAFVLGTRLASAQGTFVYDQQSTGSVDASANLNQTPIGQSFTPMLDSIGFIEIQLFDGLSASTVAINIRSGSIAGSVLGTSLPTTVPGSSSGIYDFFFSNPIMLTPGTKYYFEPVVVSGGFAGSDFTFIQYLGGDAIIGGTTDTDRDFWFREGVINAVPEPASAALFAVAGGALCWHRRKRRAT
jgi:hypothetical protein